MELRCAMLRTAHVPKGLRRPRRRRPSNPSPGQGYISGFLSCKDGSSTTNAARIDQGNEELAYQDKKVPSFGPVRCNMSCNGRDSGMKLKCIDIPVTEVESVTGISSVVFNENSSTQKAWYGNNGPDLNDRVGTHSLAGPSSATFDKSILVKSWLVPGNVVWAKSAHHEWWPAEVMDARVALECGSNYSVGLVPVQLYGNHKYEWLDPVAELSEFDYCYEERSRNPLKLFQDALKQALDKHLHTNPGPLPDGSSGEPKLSTQNEHLFDTWNTSSASTTPDNCTEGGRSKRKRKMKIHFDELTLAEKPTRRVRRLRIMRHLGLIAPVGSPFSTSHLKSVE
ncbi:uncharacterized protein [Typha latifolia]|uniref:uncharacterized protein isoform X1 n=1 Tax=Typha latifolia TaxID=4733 RepID=UPI003C2EBC25